MNRTECDLCCASLPAINREAAQLFFGFPASCVTAFPPGSWMRLMPALPIALRLCRRFPAAGSAFNLCFPRGMTRRKGADIGLPLFFCGKALPAVPCIASVDAPILHMLSPMTETGGDRA